MYKSTEDHDPQGVFYPMNLRRGTQPGRTHNPVVYYMTSEYGGVIKIGCTVNLVKRLHTMNQSRAVKYYVLGIEDGDQQLEYQRHMEFRPVRQRSDFFWATPEFVNAMRSRTRSPMPLLGWALEDANE